MAKLNKNEVVIDVVPAYNVGDIVKTTKEINGMFIGQDGTIVSSTDKVAVVEFKTGMQAGQELRCPVHALSLFKKFRARKQAK